jgi:DNA-binding XRE family transcriptional regulator
VTEQSLLSFAGLLRQLRVEAKLTQEELAEAAGVSPRSVSDLERGINRTAHKDTALMLAGALHLTEPVSEVFVAAARGKIPPMTCWRPGKGGHPTRITGSRGGREGAPTEGCCRSASPRRRCSTGESGWPLARSTANEFPAIETR